MPEIDRDRNVDCERSDETHVSDLDQSPSLVFENQPGGRAEYAGPELVYTGTFRPLNTALASNFNNTVRRANEMLWASLNSPKRIPYGQASFFESEFALEQMSQLVRLLGKTGVKDRPFADIKELDDWTKKGLGRVTGAKNILELGTISTNQIAQDLEVTLLEARKIRRQLLEISLKELDITSIPKGAKLPNPIIERFETEFPAAKLRELERSAGVLVKAPPPSMKRPAKKKSKGKR